MNDFRQQASAVLERAEVLVEEAEVAAAYDRLAHAIAIDLAQSDPVILCVMVGGLHATAEITRRLRFPFELDYLQASRYRGETQGGSLMWKVSPSLTLNDRHVLVIDDILDEGHTLAGILQCLSRQSPASLQTAVLVDKQHDRREEGLRADYVGIEMPDRFLIGCGMDYRNYFRQLPYIAALPTSE